MPSATEVTVRRWIVRAEGTAVVATVATAAVVGVVALAVRGTGAVPSAILGVGDVAVFFALGAAIDVWVIRRFGMTGLAFILGGYALRLGLLSLAITLMAAAGWLLQPAWFAIGAAVTAIAWPAGLIVGHLMGRWPVYDLAVTVGGA